MMTLTTVSKKTSNNSALVFWRVGTKRKGILDVHIDFDHEEADLLAELVAIRYLALDKQVFCREPGAGAGYKLVVSKGAIKKLALGKSTKAFAFKFAACLTGRLPGVKILEMINSARQSGIHGTNFRTSCHTLVENGLLNKYRNASLKLAFRLTDDGRERAGEIYRKRLEEVQDK
ncbi:hypothetical protein AB1Y39_09335 [Escherichia coli]|uniref:hypothetical protein n=2 Tax=Escherichia coli TaxID=562 RepID=UPI00345C47C8